MWDPASSKNFLRDCTLCRHTDTREFIPGVVFEKQCKQFAWLVHTKLIVT